MYRRLVNLPENHSFFLLGARGTGKSTLVKSFKSPDSYLYINLLLAKEEDLYQGNPDELIATVGGLSKTVSTVIIDEIQKIPKLLDIVHELIETTNINFVLTGSSARRLKAQSANLLAGRAFQRVLFPLNHLELANDFDLESKLRWGGLPKIFSLDSTDDKDDFLRTYANHYLKEEVWSEQFIRKLNPFRKFLETAAQANGTIVNFSNISRDSGVDDKTVKSYFEILEDTLMGFFLTSYSTSVRKTVYKTPKFYFFDVGVARALARHLDIIPKPGTSYYGNLFEQMVINEIIQLAQYYKPDYTFNYLRTKSNVELDLIVTRPGKTRAIVEIKSTEEISGHKLHPMEAFRDEFPDDDFYCLSRTRQAKKYGSVKALHWTKGIAEILELSSESK